MSLLRKFERRLQPLAIPHVVIAIVFGQTFVYLTSLLRLIDPSRLELSWKLVSAGEWWRLTSFTLTPPNQGPVFIAFALYLLYLFGTALEHELGQLRLNLFLFTGWLFTVATAFALPNVYVTNTFIGGSLFLAFAYVFPDFTLNLFFILPIKVRWLAWGVWAYFTYTLIFGDTVSRVLALASSANFFLFFGAQILNEIRSGKRRLSRQISQHTAQRAAAANPRHRCVACAKNSDTHPQEDFRYCSKCADESCYCEEHLRTHIHVVASPPKEPVVSCGIK